MGDRESRSNLERKSNIDRNDLTVIFTEVLVCTPSSVPAGDYGRVRTIR
jgi:hypothetical protein